MQTALTSPRCLKMIVGYTICHLLAIFILSSHHQAFFALDSFLGISVISSVWVKFLVVTITLFHFSFYKWGYWSLGRWPFWSLILSCRGKNKIVFTPLRLISFPSISFPNRSAKVLQLGFMSGAGKLCWETMQRVSFRFCKRDQGTWDRASFGWAFISPGRPFPIVLVFSLGHPVLCA